MAGILVKGCAHLSTTLRSIVAFTFILSDALPSKVGRLGMSIQYEFPRKCILLFIMCIAVVFKYQIHQTTAPHCSSIDVACSDSYVYHLKPSDQTLSTLEINPFCLQTLPPMDLRRPSSIHSQSIAKSPHITPDCTAKTAMVMNIFWLIFFLWIYGLSMISNIASITSSYYILHIVCLLNIYKNDLIFTF